jgi:phosphate transport system substrate-binding protein
MEPLTAELSCLPDTLFMRGGKEFDRKARLRGEPTIIFEKDFPKLDGATALYPIYYSAVSAIYKKPEAIDNHKYKNRFLACSRSGGAYDRLIEGAADIIFVSAPSYDQLEHAKSQGVELALTPIGKEAFVFIVNEQNPISSLTIEQVQKIYTGEITNWREVGGKNKTILAFQRNANSGSQTAMENSVMKDLPLKTAIKEEVSVSMGGLLNVIADADYRNAENAIGYSFRFFVTDMQETKGVRLLAINGVEPTPENIANGSYPLTQEFYIVARKGDITPNAQKLIDWFLSDQGQALIKDVGYIPLKGF